MAGTSSVLRDFCAEAEELLDAFWDGVERLETDAQHAEARPPRLHQLFRHAHSLKGLAGMSGLTAFSSAAHQLEDALDALRMGKEAWNPGTCAWLRQVCQALQAEVRRLISGARPSADPMGVVVPARAGAGGSPASKLGVQLSGGDVSLRSVLSQYEESRLDFHLRRQTPISIVRACWNLEEMGAGLRELLCRLEPAGEVIASVPERTTPAGAEFAVLIAGDPERAREACGDLARVQPLIQPEAAPPPAEEDLGHTLRVDVERLDPALGRAGELALHARHLEQCLQRAFECLGRPAELQEAWRLAGQLSMGLGKFHSGLVQLRMIPMRRLASRLDRTVRDLSRRSGKKVVFQCLGADTEIDKRIADTLLAPLMHMVRNAADHGIETPEERLAAGKPEFGTVTLEAWPRGHAVTLRIVDDGRGLDPEKLRQAAERMGIPAGADPESLQSLVFEPGFSTVTRVSETSGRGVGLDEVRQRVMALKGTLRIRNSPGNGVTFEMVVPATLAIVPAFLVRAAEAVLGLPLGSVLESRLLRGVELQRLRRQRVLLDGDRALPVYRLAELLGFQTAAQAPDALQALVVARHPAGDIALEVDALIGQREVMMRPLPRRLGGHPAVHGVAELEGAGVALMLDVAHLVGEGGTA